MEKNTIGMISGLLVFVPTIIYFVRTYQGKVRPNLTSWSLWTLIGLALLLTYRSSGAEANIWPAIFGFTNPLIVTFLVWRKNPHWVKPNRVEISCLILGLLSLGLWIVVQGDRELSAYALYIAIVADACAGVPTVIFVLKHPDGDRPFAWASFAIGYGLAIFAVTEHTLANYILPLYMFTAGMAIALPLVIYRVRNKIRLSEWL